MTDGIVVLGELAAAPVLAALFGRMPAGQGVRVRGLRLVNDPEAPEVLAAADPDALAPGLWLTGLDAEEAARLAFAAAALGHAAGRVTTEDGADLPAVLPPLGHDLPDWRPEPWAARHGAEAAATMADILALRGERTGAEIAARLTPMRVRAAARLRAAPPSTATLRHAPGAADVPVAARRQPYARFFSVEEYDLRFRRFDGGLQPEPVTRAVFLSGDAVTVLPYDPSRDRVLVVEQFRSGPFARGDANPWAIEAIAGRIDPGESPEAAARREAGEEAGLTLGALLPVAGYYPSPGICAEFLYSYVALCDLPDGAAGVFGVPGEAEDIRGHLIGFDDLMALITTGEIANAPLILTAYWLAARRSGLRGA